MQKISAEAKEKMDQYDKEYAENPYLENGPENGIYRIPVVFHIMHNGGVENIGNDQVIDALDQLNYQFAGGEGGFDTQIQFYLASIDPYGVYQLSDATRNLLKPYTQNKDYAATLAQNILSWYGEHYPPAYILDGTVTQPGGEGRMDKSNAIVSNKALVSVTPNPTDGFTTIRFNIPASGQDISLRIVDVNGKTHEVFNSLPSLGEVRSYFSLPGIYFYQLSSNGRLLDSGKIIVNK
jgi:hypothetical protein